jgi:hypothetical protein
MINHGDDHLFRVLHEKKVTFLGRQMVIFPSLFLLFEKKAWEKLLQPKP